MEFQIQHRVAEHLHSGIDDLHRLPHVILPATKPSHIRHARLLRAIRQGHGYHDLAGRGANAIISPAV